jgi:hypothetical protein
VPDSRNLADPDETETDEEILAELESVPTSPADVESAGRSCMAIVIMLAVILIVVGVWLVVTMFGVGT